MVYKKNILCFVGIFVFGFLMLSLVAGAGYNIVVPSPGDDSPGGGGGGGGGGGSATYRINSTQFAQGYSNILSKGDKIVFNLGDVNDTHTVLMTEITNSTASINISSETQQAVLVIGDSRRFELTGDNYYDLKVILNSINLTTKKTSLTIISNNEEITVDASVEEEQKEQEAVEQKKKDIAEEIKKNRGRILGIVVIAIVALILLFLIVYFIRKNQRFKEMMKKRKLYI